MNWKTPSSLAAVLVAATLATGCAGPAPAVTSEGHVAQLGEVLRAENAPGGVLLKPVAAEVRVGQAVAFDVVPRRTGYLYLYHVGSDGSTLQMLFPNATDSANLVSGPARLPRPNWQLRAAGPQGVGHFLAVLTEQPQDLLAQAESLRNGRISIKGSYAASMAQIRELP